MTATATVLAPSRWRELAQAHADRVDTATAARRARAGTAATHAVDDFVYDYYGARPARLRRWHPGAGVALHGATEHSGWRWYVRDGDTTRFDAGAWWASRADTVDFVERLLAATASRPMGLGCFGMHEWAMVYRAADPERRHALPLRLGTAGTDAVVEAHPLRCTHVDAFRFFTPAAAPLNATPLTRATQVESEQPGCLHATMDLFKWCLKLSPAIPSDLLMDCFDLAVDVRRVDMRASPYDITRFGLEPIAVETAEGKSDYAAYQRAFAVRAQPLRERLAAACQTLRMETAESEVAT